MQRGTSLLEFVAAVAIFGILVIGMQSSVLVSLQSIPSSTSPIALECKAQRIIDSMAAELESAIFISELTTSSIAFTVADRNADGSLERIRYAWSGTVGGPLTRQLNNGAATSLIASVNHLSFVSQTKSESTAYPGLCVEDASESLLIDQSNASQLLDHDVSSSQSLAQRLVVELPSGSYAWRPTRVQLLAKYAGLLGMCTVQLRGDSLGCAPTSEIWQQQYLSWLTLGSNYSWQNFDLVAVDPLASGSGFILVMQRYFGSRSATFASSDATNGMLKGNSTASLWELQDSRGLLCQIYGKQWRAGSARTLTNAKTTAIEVSLQTSSNVPSTRTTINLLNEPPVLANYWNLDFTTLPTSQDANGDGLADWSLNRAGSISPVALTSGGWQTGGDQLVSTQDCDFNTPTTIELTAQSDTLSTEGAVLSLNVLRTGTNCVPLTIRIKKQSDGTQSVSVQARINDSQAKTLLNLNGQNNSLVNLRLIIDPAISAVSLFVGEAAYGTFAIAPYASSQSSRRITVGASGSSALFRTLKIKCQ